MKKINIEFRAMTTTCTVDLFTTHESQATALLHQVQQNTRQLEKKYNFHDPDSWLNQVINRRSTHHVTLDPETASILQTVRELSTATRGHFDITTGTIQECYRQPTLAAMQECLEERRQWFGLHAWEIDGQTLTLPHPQTRMDLGGVIKEHAVDETAHLLNTHGIHSALINFGGDVRAIGHKPDGRPFSVAIKNPKNRQAILTVVTIANQALTTSGSYERIHQVGNGRFSHILSPRVTSGEILSATMIGESTLRCGVYSTAFMLDTNIPIPDDLKVILIDRNLHILQNIQTP
ncbi:MAG: FAD:protein FMN transferase [Magnetococcales bacterium]|nr:FAD:protein FMN transferase [Magnetococcales bacterium]NGZ06240.1 FAD:protein FMN transferase [Magnetococcales bacterium]